jgi:hypothetical protein
MLQMVSEPAYADIIAELLFTCEGQEMYLRSPASFNIPLGEMTVALHCCTLQGLPLLWQLQGSPDLS